MNYSKIGILVMFIFSMVGLYIGIEMYNAYVPLSILGLVLFVLATFIYVKCIYDEVKYRKRERNRNPKKVVILNAIKFGAKLNR